MNTAPHFARESHEAQYKAIQYLMGVGAELGIKFSFVVDGDTITIVTCGWSVVVNK